MKAYKFEVVIIDFENMGEQEIKHCLENAKYISPLCISQGSADIGEWHDDHPLNKRATMHQAALDLFR